MSPIVPTADSQLVTAQLYTRSGMHPQRKGRMVEFQEIFVPGYNVASNSFNQCFFCDAPRNTVESFEVDEPARVMPLTEIKIPKDIVNKIVRLANLLKEVDETTQDVSTALKGVFKKLD